MCSVVRLAVIRSLCGRWVSIVSWWGAGWTLLVLYQASGGGAVGEVVGEPLVKEVGEPLDRVVGEPFVTDSRVGSRVGQVTGRHGQGNLPTIKWLNIILDKILIE